MDKNTKWAGGLIIVNSLGMGGVNTTMLLKPFENLSLRTNRETLNLREITNKPKSLISQLVTVSGRTEDGVRLTLEHVRSLQHSELSGEYYSYLIPEFGNYSSFRLRNKTTSISTAL